MIVACSRLCVCVTIADLQVSDLSRHRNNAIPCTIYVTQKFGNHSSEVMHMKANIEPKATIELIDMPMQSSFLNFAPPGCSLTYFDNPMMDESARAISEELEQAGEVEGAYKAMSTLKPVAFKVDLWRLMTLWSKGGVYLDFDIVLDRNLSEWINFESDGLVMVKDAGVKKALECNANLGIWNAMMASTPRHPVVAKMLRELVANVQSKAPGRCPLDITGPSALGRALLAIPDWQHQTRLEYSFQTPKVVKEANPAMVIAHNDATPHGAYDEMWRDGQVFMK